MPRFLAGTLASFLMMTGAFLFWQGHAQQPSEIPPPPPPATPQPSMLARKPAPPPKATPKSREEQRFNRADRDNDGKIVLDELLEPRKTRFGNLDKDGDGKLSFREWAHTTIEKFDEADADRKQPAPHTGGICDDGAQAAQEAEVRVLTSWRRRCRPGRPRA